MSISSRTPEGTPNRCGVCRKKLRVEPSIDSLDAPCPHCGNLLWFSAPARKRTRRRVSYEGFIIAEGKVRLGAFPLKRQLKLIRAVRLLRRQNRLPEPSEMTRIILAARDWKEVVDELYRIAGYRVPRPRRTPWLYLAVKLVRRQLRRLTKRSAVGSSS